MDGDIKENEGILRASDRSHSISYEDLLCCINVIPALFWRIEVAKNRIEYMNSFELPGLFEKSTLLLKNMTFSRDVILEQDFYIFENFMKSVRDRKSSVSIFRIKIDNGTVRWLKIAGGPDPYRSTYYAGYILEITDVVDSIRVLSHGGGGMRSEIDLFNNPVLLATISNRKVVAANSAAVKVLGYSGEELEALYLDDIFRGNIDHYMVKVYEEIIFHRRWNGELSFSGRDNKIFSGEVAVRAVTEGVEKILWISVYDIFEEKHITGEDLLVDINDISFQDSSISNEIRDAAQNGDMIRILEILLENQPQKNFADSILYSDVYEKEGLVYTYGVGPSFESLEPGMAYPFEGTIAENIVDYSLESIIVEDTFQSIKPIDWALFIPRDVKSYYGRPFYERGEVRTVLVFCSQKTSVFNDENIPSYESILPLFLEGLKIWRKFRK